MADPSSPQQIPQLNGVLVLNKPSGPSSGQCLYALKRLGQKKIGHAGTLDPLASGVLLVLLGCATKISGQLMAAGHKVYSGVLRLGLETDTWDILGRPVREKPCPDISQSSIDQAVQEWQETEEQVVPAFSAAKHNGQPLYRLARKNLPVPEKRKKIKVLEAGILDIRLPFVHFRVRVSSGSYIRSLAHSLGKRLGCGATLTSLVREFSHPFGLDSAVRLSALKKDPALLRIHLQPLQSALSGWQVIELSSAQTIAARNGQTLHLKSCGGSPALLMRDGVPVALAAREREKPGDSWKIVRGLWS